MPPVRSPLPHCRMCSWGGKVLLRIYILHSKEKTRAGLLREVRMMFDLLCIGKYLGKVIWYSSSLSINMNWLLYLTFVYWTWFAWLEPFDISYPETHSRASNNWFENKHLNRAEEKAKNGNILPTGNGKLRQYSQSKLFHIFWQSRVKCFIREGVKKKYFFGILPKLMPLVHLEIQMSLLAIKKVGFWRPKTMATKISHKV